MHNEKTDIAGERNAIQSGTSVIFDGDAIGRVSDTDGLVAKIWPCEGGFVYRNCSDIQPIEDYKGYKLVAKQDFGAGKGFLINGNWIKRGVIVTDGFCNVMPGACWFESVAKAQHGIDCLIVANGVSGEFWKLVRA